MLQLERNSQSSEVFKQNITALSKRQPALADRLASVELPDSIHCATGRDGLPVIVDSWTENRIGWMGGSSMPSVSAPAVLSNFVDRGVNVALPSIGSGYECLHLLRLLQPHCAAFVCEESSPRLAATLCVVELDDPIADGRLILLDGNVEETLPRFIDEHPGYDFPTQLLTLPEFDAVGFKSRTDTVHRACHIAAQQHLKHLAALRERIAPGVSSPKNSPHVAILSVDAVGGAIEHAQSIERAACNLGWTTSISVPNHPQSCSLVSRVQAIAERPVDLVLLLNTVPGQLADYLTESIDVACWYLDDSRLPSVALEGIGDVRRLIAASQEVKQILVDRAAPVDRIRVIEKGVDHVRFGNAGVSTDSSDAVLVFADAKDLSPNTANIGLESHEKLWAEMQQSITQASDRKKAIDLAELLKKAERSTGIKLNDDSLRRQFLGMVNERMPKTIVTRSAVEAMVAANISVELFGRHWKSHDSVASICHGVIPNDADRAKYFAKSCCGVFAYCDAQAVGHALEAIASGCLPLMRADYNGLLNQYDRASRTLQKVPKFGTYAELIAMVRKWSFGGDDRNRLVEQLRDELLESHKTSDRLAELFGWACS